MKKVIAALFFFSTPLLICSSFKEEEDEDLVKECVLYHADQTTKAFILFTHSDPSHHPTLSTAFFVATVQTIAASALALEKENRPRSVPIPPAPHSPHPLFNALQPAAAALHTFKEEEDRTSIAKLFNECIERDLATHSRSSSPLKNCRPLTPRQE
jgi:hypothetical protein